MGGACLRPKKSDDDDDNRPVSNQNAARNYKQREQKPRSTPESPSQAIKKSCCDYKLVCILYKNLDQLVGKTFNVQDTIGLGK